MIQDGRTFTKIVLANGGVIETAAGTDIVTVDANGVASVVANLQDTLASGKIYVGNSSNVSAEVTPTGDVTISNTGVTSTTKVAGAPKRTQATPTAKTTSATLTAAEILAGIVTVNQGGAASSALQLPTVTDLEAALTDEANNDAFDFSVINISTVDAEDASITTNTGWTLVGKMDVLANNAAATANTSGLFRAHKTGTGTWTLYRIA